MRLQIEVFSLTQDSFKINCDIGEAFADQLDEDAVTAAARAALMAEGLGGQPIEVSVAVSDDEEVQRLNRQYRGVDRTTDVLSFSAEEAPNWNGYAETEDLLDETPDDSLDEDEDEDGNEDDPDEEASGAAFEFKLPPGFAESEAGGLRYLGDIIISYPQAERQAHEFANTPQREAQELIIHGVFHLLGYDHEVPEQREVMRAKEEAAARILDGGSVG